MSKLITSGRLTYKKGERNGDPWECLHCTSIYGSILFPNTIFPTIFNRRALECPYLQLRRAITAAYNLLADESTLTWDKRVELILSHIKWVDMSATAFTLLREVKARQTIVELSDGQYRHIKVDESLSVDGAGPGCHIAFDSLGVPRVETCVAAATVPIYFIIV